MPFCPRCGNPCEYGDYGIREDPLDGNRIDRIFIIDCPQCGCRFKDVEVFFHDGRYDPEPTELEGILGQIRSWYPEPKSRNIRSKKRSR
ncbi:MAG: hypothetical protein E7Z63_01035 [Thermoplasmata archaeon]|nr:hypothetical protein [Thermoplasmata archaeon]